MRTAAACGFFAIVAPATNIMPDTECAYNEYLLNKLMDDYVSFK